MRRKEVPQARGLSLYVLRALRGWTQVELADALGTTASVISEYETGRRRTSEKAFRRAAEAVGIPLEKLYSLLSHLNEMQALVGSPPPSRNDRMEKLVEELYAGLESVAREVVEVLLLTVRRDFPPSLQATEPVDILWARLKSVEKKHRQVVVELVEEFQIWKLCKRLCERSQDLSADSEESGLELAELALHVAERVGGEDAWRRRVQGYAWAHIGSARRKHGDFSGAREAFAHFRQLWEEGASGDPSGRLDEALVLGLEAGESGETAVQPGLSPGKPGWGEREPR
jgi:transcriptional regulator with XRE-family HTH domain